MSLSKSKHKINLNNILKKEFLFGLIFLIAFSSSIFAQNADSNSAQCSFNDVVQIDPDRPNLYFAYGSNLSYDFLKERLKDGNWMPDGWHKSGKLNGLVPVYLGTYILEDYEFGYTLDLGNETTGNIIPKKGSKVFGILYRLSDNHLKDLDKSEDVPRDYLRVAVRVDRVAISTFNKDVPTAEAWVYVGNKKLVTNRINPDPMYVDLLVRSAIKAGFSET